MSHSRKAIETISETFNEVVDTSNKQIKIIADSIKNQMIDTLTAQLPLEKLEIRDLYPRMGWHDIHCGISGPAARDVSSHFVKRWNHHLIAAGYKKVLPICDVTDNVAFGICAKCMTENISETATECPQCGNYLGPMAYFLLPLNPKFLPTPSNAFYCISFSCVFGDILGMTFTGDHPTMVNTVRYDISSLVLQSTLTAANDNISGLPETFIPQAGDILVSIDEYQVIQLDHEQVERIIARLKKLMATKENDKKMTLVFRRHIQQRLMVCNPKYYI